MIPTKMGMTRVGEQLIMFQSRNRETYDSNKKFRLEATHIIRCFNLVIEKLMIPTLMMSIPFPVIFMFQSRNRETYDSNFEFAPSHTARAWLFQSRNRETYDSNFFLFNKCYFIRSVSIS